MRDAGADRPVRAMKPGNSGGAKGRVTRVCLAANREGGAGERTEAIRDFQAPGVDCLLEGEGQQVGSRCRRGVDPGVREQPQGEPLQALESAVLGELLSAAGAGCRLAVNPAKTHIVYCKDGRRTGSYETDRFDFLGYTFRARRVRKLTEGALPFVGFCPAVSDAARKAISRTIRRWRLHLRSGTSLQGLARQINPIVRGWINYYGRYYPSMLNSVLDHINVYLVRWARRKFKRLRTRPWATWRMLTRIARSDPQLFAHWSLGVRPTAG